MNENALMLACLRGFPGSGEIDRIIQGGVDWDRFIAIVSYNSLGSVILKNLGAYPVPQDTRGKLRRLEYSAIMDSLFLTNELCAVAKNFKSCGIDFVPLKGVVLDHEIYRVNDLIRSFADIDILVRPEDIGSVKSMLSAGGYVLEAKSIGEYLERKCRYHYPFRKELHKKPISLEIHTNLYPPFSPFSVKAADVFGDTTTVVINGIEFRVMSREHMVVYLCTHLTYLHINRPSVKYLYEIAQLVRQGVDREKIEHLAAQQKTASFVLLALRLSKDLLDADIDETLMAELEKRSPSKERMLHKTVLKREVVREKEKLETCRKQWWIHLLFADSCKKILLVLFQAMWDCGNRLSCALRAPLRLLDRRE